MAQNAPAAAPNLAPVVLAAGAGTRMRSAPPTPVNPVGGLNTLGYALRAADARAPGKALVVAGEGAARVAQSARAFSGAQIDKPDFAARLRARFGLGHG